jgi:hypothetical protein
VEGDDVGCVEHEVMIARITDGGRGG